MGKQTVIPQKPVAEQKLGRLRKTAEDNLTRLLVKPLARTTITPNAVSWLGLILTLGAAALIVSEHFLAAAFAVLVAGLFDMLDGALARSTNQVTKFGGILDSTLDRVAEAVILLSLMPVYARQQSVLGVSLVGLTLVGSYMVSYIRARAEGAGLQCEVGVFTRPERVVTLALGLLLSQVNLVFLTIALGIIAVISFISAGQRLLHTWRETSGK